LAARGGLILCVVFTVSSYITRFYNRFCFSTTLPVLAAQGVQLPSADGFSLRNTRLNIKQVSSASTRLLF
ncbi:hypothetical protein RRG08_061809, partial [Elysia crispata]